MPLQQAGFMAGHQHRDRSRTSTLYQAVAHRRRVYSRIRAISLSATAAALRDDIAQLEWVLAETLCVPRDSVRMTDAA